MGSMSMDTIQTITVHHPQPRSRLRPQATRATNLTVLLHDMRVGTGQVLHMPDRPVIRSIKHASDGGQSKGHTPCLLMRCLLNRCLPIYAQTSNFEHAAAS